MTLLSERLEKSWSFSQFWNESLERDKERPVEPRERIWASELGGSMIDRYLKMTGVKPTNPPNPRSRRKFEAGNLWEHIIGYVLRRAGILIDSQEWVKYQYEGLLPVTGKLDFMAGGKPDYEKAIHAIKNEVSWLPEFITEASLSIVNHLKEKFPNGMNEIVLEIKSCSSFMFEVYEKNQTASPQHKLQAFHYLMAKNMQEAHVVYVCRDDCRLMEVGVYKPSEIEHAYKSDIETITEYVRTKQMPPKEKPIVFDRDFKKFSANFKVGYSQYLTMLYGLNNQMEFDERYKPIAERWNRVLSRVREGKEMTANNLEAVKEMAEQGFNIDEIKEVL